MEYAEQKYDLIIIGGGVYGIMLSHEAARKGLRSILLERDGFGEHTSANSLRIIHGGFRYLQTLNLPRFRESVGERTWFLKNFPEYVKPLPCLIPLYGKGLRRPSVLKTALAVNDILSWQRNQGVRDDRRLPRGKVVNAAQTDTIFPAVDKNGLVGAALWYDAFMPDSNALLHHILETARQNGAAALNRCEAVELVTRGNTVAGVKVVSQKNGEKSTVFADAVVNAAGPWSRGLTRIFGREIQKLFYPSLAWNVLFDREALSDHAVAVTPKKKNARTYFIVPLKGKLFAGTGHAPWESPVGKAAPGPGASQLEGFISEINDAVPGLTLDKSEITAIHAGLLPVKTPGQVNLSEREEIIDHGKNGGVKGLYSVCGVKFTTSRLVAEKTLKVIFKQGNPRRA
ncbi:MAG: FAD-dependent oxidoreductase [Desulfobacteraceae bacterium]|nr:FAD-dependent oxidoreductase [Desulfobacteraceae bacterium]